MKMSPAASTAMPVGSLISGAGGRSAVAAVARRAGSRDRADQARREVDLADDVIAAVGDEQVPRRVQGDAHGVVERGAGGRSAVATVAPGPAPRHGADHARGGVDFTNDVVVAVGNEEVPRAVYGDVQGIVEFGAGGRPAVAAIVPGAVSDDRLDQARGCIDLANGVVKAVANEEIAGGIHGHGRGIAELRTGGRSAVAAIAPGPAARHVADLARGDVDLTDDAVGAVGNEAVSRTVYRDARGVVKFGAGGRSAVAAIAAGPISGDRADCARGEIHRADDVVAAVGDEEVPRGVRRNARRVVEPGARGRGAIAAVAAGPVSGDRADHARGEIHRADDVVAAVGDEEVSRTVYGNGLGKVQLGTHGRGAVAAVTTGPVSGDGADHARGGVDLADYVVSRVGDEDVPGSVHRDAHGSVQLGAGGRSMVALVSTDAAAGDRRNRARNEIHLTDRVVAGVRDEEVSRTVDRQALGRVQRGLGDRLAIAPVAVQAGDCGNRIQLVRSRVAGRRHAARRRVIEDVVHGHVGCLPVLRMGLGRGCASGDIAQLVGDGVRSIGFDSAREAVLGQHAAELNLQAGDRLAVVCDRALEIPNVANGICGDKGDNGRGIRSGNRRGIYETTAAEQGTLFQRFHVKGAERPTITAAGRFGTHSDHLLGGIGHEKNSQGADSNEPSI